MTISVEERLGYSIKSAEVAFMAAKADALRPLGLTVAQYAALLTLGDHPGISGAGLARACLVTPQAMAATLKTLQAKDLITRTLDDWNRSARPTELTQAGRDMLARADEAAGSIEQDMHDALTPSERQTLRELLRKCETAARRRNPAPRDAKPPRKTHAPRPDNSADTGGERSTTSRRCGTPCRSCARGSPP